LIEFAPPRQLNRSAAMLVSTLMKRWVILLVATAFVLAIAIFAFSSVLDSSPHVWTPRFDHRIVYANEASSTCALYFSNNGDLLIDLRPKGDALYIVNPRANEIGMPNQSNFYFAFGYAYSKTLTPPMVSMNHSAGKLDVNPDLRVEEYAIEFTSAKNARVSVNWWLGK
jgi:hypothetical protein